METLKCGCIEGYNLCSEAKKIYFPPRALGENHGAALRKQRLAMWKKIHEHYDLNRASGNDIVTSPKSSA